MPELDLLIRGARPFREIGIADGKIAALAPGPARAEIDASGLLVLPGVVDAHVHFNEPRGARIGKDGKPGRAGGGRGGGVTTVCDMPLNSTPPVVTVAAFDAKRAAAGARSVCDFALWGGLVPGHLDDLEPLAARGVMGFKAFMSHSGVDDFPTADLATLRSGMECAARLKLPVAVHAEFDRSAPRAGTGVRDFLASRPIESECEAIAAAIDIAGETGCALHVVHVSSARGVELIAQARERCVDVTCETCPHYLLFTGEDMERIGAAAKCAPPMRDAKNLAALWNDLRAGRVQTVGSDHSPSPWSLKEDADFFKVWGGISGVQHLLPALLDTGVEPELFARVAAENPARRFRLAHKGALVVGADADLALVEIGEAREVRADALFYRHRHSPYVGRRLRARVRRTLVRGRTVFQDGKITTASGGQFLKPFEQPT